MATMYTKNDIENAVRDSIKSVTGIEALDKDASLVDSILGISPASFLYIFDILENNYLLSAYDILRTKDFHIMTIKNLTDALYEQSVEMLEASPLL